jgi:hypothetical protein
MLYTVNTAMQPMLKKAEPNVPSSPDCHCSSAVSHVIIKACLSYVCLLSRLCTCLQGYEALQRGVVALCEVLGRPPPVLAEDEFTRLDVGGGGGPGPAPGQQVSG